jgi:hypothetical protein
MAAFLLWNVKKKPLDSLVQCEQLKSWWNFCTQNCNWVFAWQFTGVSHGVSHVF